MSENVVKDIFRSATDRLSSPISGVYILAWLICNWRIPISIIAGSMPPGDRISLIENHFSISSFTDALMVYGLPFAVTLFFLFVIPLFREWYANWLERVEYRIARNRLRVQEDLVEERDYRTTLLSMNALLVDEIKSAAMILGSLGDQEVKIQERDKGVIVSTAITAKSKADRLNLVVEQFGGFGRTYTGELPDRYKLFSRKWGKK